MTAHRLFIPALALIVVGTSLASAQEKPADKAAADDTAAAKPVVAEQPAPYDERLQRLAEVVGSVHYLRNLCKGGEDGWRTSMQGFIDTETANEPKRKEKLVAAFNRGWRGFASVYTSCTPQALEAEARYRAEGATLANEIIARYGN